MDYLAVEEQIKAGYREVTAQYRRDDEVEVETQNHRRLAQRLQRICWSFPHPISVLDAGCGTGRFFHCVQNASSLTGVDFSEEMLAAAERPVRQEQITAKTIKLICANIFLISFPPQSFDLIYSLGMFGHGCPVTVETCDTFHAWLKPGGKLFFNLVDFAGLPLWYRSRRWVRQLMYPLLPRRLQRVLDRREQRAPFFGLAKAQLETILARTRFQKFTVTSQVCRSPLWSGRLLECVALKEVSASACSEQEQGAKYSRRLD